MKLHLKSIPLPLERVPKLVRLKSRKMSEPQSDDQKRINHPEVGCTAGSVCLSFCKIRIHEDSVAWTWVNASNSACGLNVRLAYEDSILQS